MASASGDGDEQLLALLSAGHWFLKHRAKGDMPHRRFVYIEDNGTIFWATRQDRAGKLGSLSVDAGTMVVPGAATDVTASKKRLHDRRNRLFSIVGAARSLDLETANEAERHLWVRAFSVFVRRHAVTGHAHSACDGGRLYSMSVDSMSTDYSEAPSAALAQVHMARHNTEELMAGLRFPRLRGSFHVRLGDLAGSWQLWTLELEDGELTALEHRAFAGRSRSRALWLHPSG